MSGLLRLHQLALAGQEESEAADLVRESMHDHWEGLSKVEKERLTGLSKDLYEISDGVQETPATITSEQSQASLVKAFEARERGEWDKALELLRVCAPHVPQAIIAYFRGRVWQRAGEPQVAGAFLEHALRLEPSNVGYQAVHLHNMKDSDPQAAKVQAEVVLNVSNERAIPVVAYAADIVFDSTRSLPEADAQLIVRSLIPKLERAVASTEDASGSDRTARCALFNLLAASYRVTGDVKKAYEYYSRAIQTDPSNSTLLVSRGILMYGTNPGATADFEQAIRLNSPLIWPYFYMAHHYLTNNRFEECRVMCERALHKQAPPSIASQLSEFLAISLSALEYPETVVRRAFENAIRVDPTNERARHNLEKFETALATRTPRSDWERMSESSLRKFGEYESRSDPAFMERLKPELV